MNSVGMQASRVWQCNAPDELPRICTEMYDNFGAYSVWLLDGPMGAGKTTFVKALAKTLGVAQHVGSPSFSIVNEYLSDAGKLVYHFDCYRLKDEWEALDLGWEHYLSEGDLCLIEWPSVVSGLIPDRHLLVNLSVDEETQARTIKVFENE